MRIEKQNLKKWQLTNRKAQHIVIIAAKQLTVKNSKKAASSKGNLLVEMTDVVFAKDKNC